MLSKLLSSVLLAYSANAQEQDPVVHETTRYLTPACGAESSDFPTAEEGAAGFIILSEVTTQGSEVLSDLNDAPRIPNGTEDLGSTWRKKMAYDDICMLTHMELCWSDTSPLDTGNGFNLCKASMTYANCASVTAADTKCS